MPDEPTPTEVLIQGALQRGDYETALVTAFEAYRPEVLAFVRARVPSNTDADEVLADVAVALWTTLPKLTLHSSMRSYLFQMARHSAYRHLRGEVRERRVGVPIEGLTSGAIGRVPSRTNTPNHLKTTNKHGVARLREQLSDNDQALLQLRVDRGFSFREIAQAMADDGVALSETEVQRHAARWRKRYQATKERLRVLALEAGLLT